MSQSKINFIIVDWQDQQSIFDDFFSQFDNWMSYRGNVSNIIKYDCLIAPDHTYGDVFSHNHYNAYENEIKSRQKAIIKKIPNISIDIIQSFTHPNMTNLLIPIGNQSPKFVFYIPTMEYMRGNNGNPNIYQVMSKILHEILKHNQFIDENKRTRNSKNKKILNVVIPFLGTDKGELTYVESAQQMSLAYQFFKDNYPDIF